LQSAELPFFNEKSGTVKFYGTYDVSVDPDKVKMACLHKIDNATSQELAEVFKVLGDQTRIKILSLLAAEEELCVCDIAEALEMGQSAISHQLRLLRDRGLVGARRDGQRMFYRLADEHVEELLRIGLQHAAEDVLDEG
jgi:DNA-binding transcriptional ArsR family regulator